MSSLSISHPLLDFLVGMYNLHNTTTESRANCTTRTLIVTLILNREHFTEDDLASIKKTLSNIIHTCQASKNSKLYVFSIGDNDRSSLSKFECHIGVDDCDNMISNMTITSITYK